MTSKKDELAMNLLAEVNKQKEEINKAEKGSFNTNCAFSYTERAEHATNIQVAANVKDLVRMAAFLKSSAKNYEETAKELGVEDLPKFTWSGYTLEEWMGDFKTRISKIQIAAKKKRLSTLEDKLNGLVSKEKREELELAAIEQELLGKK